MKVYCENPFHRGPADGPDFTLDEGNGRSVADVDADTARELVAENDHYTCPALDTVADVDPDAEDADTHAGKAIARLANAVDGVGPKYAKALYEAGITSPEALANAEADTLAGADALDDVTGDRIQDWIESVQ